MAMKQTFKSWTIFNVTHRTNKNTTQQDLKNRTSLDTKSKNVDLNMYSCNSTTERMHLQPLASDLPYKLSNS